MEKNTIKVIKGYSELTYVERYAVREFIENYEKEELDKRKPIIKSLCESLGPLDTNICPCCGK